MSADLFSRDPERACRSLLVTAEDAIRAACAERAAVEPGETAEAATERWSAAFSLEEPATAARKTARAALVRLRGLVVTAPEATPSRWIIAAAAAEAALHSAMAAHAQRQIRAAARDLKRAVAEAAEAERQKGGRK
jgi:hypothetical protein